MINIMLINERRDFQFTKTDMEYLNNNEVGTIFTEIPCHTLIPQDCVFVFIEIAKTIGLNTIYDILKYSLMHLLGHIQKKIPKEESSTTYIFRFGDKEYSLTFPTGLTEAQQDKLLDAAIEKFIQL